MTFLPLSSYLTLYLSVLCFLPNLMFQVNCFFLMEISLLCVYIETDDDDNDDAGFPELVGMDAGVVAGF